MTGPRWLQALRQLELQPVEWQWVVGFPSRPFQPHQDLAGVTFRDWQDEALTNLGGFPPTSHLYPGDHNGCLCDTIPLLAKGGGTLAPIEEGEDR